MRLREGPQPPGARPLHWRRGLLSKRAGPLRTSAYRGTSPVPSLEACSSQARGTHRRRPTDARYPLHAEVPQQGVHCRVVSGVQLVAVDADVEFEPVGVAVHCCLPRGQEFLIFGTFLGPVAMRVTAVSRKRTENERGLAADATGWTLGPEHAFIKRHLCAGRTLPHPRFSAAAAGLSNNTSQGP